MTTLLTQISGKLEVLQSFVEVLFEIVHFP